METIAVKQLYLEPEKGVRGKQRPRVTKHGTYTPKETMAAEAEIKDAWIAQNDLWMEDWEGPILVNISAGKATPKSVSNKRVGTCWTMKPDIDNIGKLVTDALNGVAYKDDSQIVSIHVNKDPWLAKEEKDYLSITIMYVKEETK